LVQHSTRWDEKFRNVCIRRRFGRQCRRLFTVRVCIEGKRCRTVVTELKRICKVDARSRMRRCSTVPLQKECRKLQGIKTCRKVAVKLLCHEEGVARVRTCRVVRMAKVCPGSKYYKQLLKEHPELRNQLAKPKRKGSKPNAKDKDKRKNKRKNKDKSKDKSKAKARRKPKKCIIIPVRHNCNLQRKCAASDSTKGLCGEGLKKRQDQAKWLGGPMPKPPPVNVTELLIPRIRQSKYVVKCHYAPYSEAVHRKNCCKRKVARRTKRRHRRRRKGTQKKPEEQVHDSTFQELQAL